MKMLQYEKLMFRKELIKTKEVHQNNVSFVTIGFLKVLDLNLENMFVIDVMTYQQWFIP